MAVSMTRTGRYCQRVLRKAMESISRLSEFMGLHDDAQTLQELGERTLAVIGHWQFPSVSIVAAHRCIRYYDFNRNNEKNSDFFVDFRGLCLT